MSILKQDYDTGQWHRLYTCEEVEGLIEAAVEKVTATPVYSVEALDDRLCAHEREQHDGIY